MHAFESCHSIVPGRKLTRWIVLSFLVFGFSSFAVAGEAMAQDTDREQASQVLELVRTANDAFEAEQFQRAYDHYLKARAIFPNEAIHYRLGQTAERLNMPFEAVEHYEDYLALEPKGDAAERIKARLPALKASLPGRLSIDSSPQGAEVHAATASGPERLGRTPLTVDRPAGELTIELTFPEHRSHRETLSVEAGVRRPITITLEELAPGEEDTVAREELRTGATGVADAVRSPTAPSGQSVAGAARESEGGSVAVWGWSAVGLGAAVLATGGVFSYLQYDATEQVNTYDKRAPGARTSELDGLKDDAMSHYRTAMISYIAGGVITAGGVGLLVYDAMRKPADGQANRENGLRLGAGADGRGAWFSVSGQF